MFFAGHGCQRRPPRGGQHMVQSHGTVVFVDIEGGFYGIISRHRQRYNPLNLPSTHQRDSLPVYFEGRVREDVVTAQQWREPLELLSIRLDLLPE
jgi:hypothetical protein